MKSTNTPVRVPRAIYVLLRRLLPSGSAGVSMLGDLHEEYSQRPRGLARDLWYAMAGVGLVVRYSVLRLPSSRIGTPRIRRLPLLRSVAQDLHLGIRNLHRRPGFAAVTVATFALGIATSTAMFSVVDSVLLKPLPFAHPEELVSIYPTLEPWRGHPTLGASWDRGSFSYPEFVDWREQQTSFLSAAAYTATVKVLLGAGTPQRIPVAQVTWNFFHMLGVSPLLGRTFTESDDAEAPGGVGGNFVNDRGNDVGDFAEGEQVLVLGHEMWATQFGEDPDIVGKTINLSDSPYRVVGVLPRGFVGPGIDGSAWMLLGGPPGSYNRQNHSLRALGRLAPSVTLEEAVAESARIMANLSAGPSHIDHRANLVPRAEDLVRKARLPLMLLAGASVVLLVVACVNVANLLLGAGIDREHEMAVRRSLGAGRRRLMRQLITETVLLATVGGLLGIAGAGGITRILVFLAPPGIARMETVGIDYRAVLFALVAATLAGILVSLVPALSATSGHPNLAGGDRRVSRSRSRFQSGLVVVQIALASMLLVGSGLLWRTMQNLAGEDTGFEPDNLLLVDLAPIRERFSDEAGGRSLAGYTDEVVANLRALPGVSDVAVSSNAPFSGYRSTNLIEPEGYQATEGELLDGERRFTSHNYSEVMGMRMVAGRWFTREEDQPNAGDVTVVSERLAHRFWPGENPVGRTLGFWGRTHRIIGVVADLRDRDLAGDEGLKYYVPIRRMGQPIGTIVIRTSVEPAELITSAREAIWAVDPDQPIRWIRPMTELMSASIDQERYRARLTIAFAVVATLLALMGIYGTASRSVARRTREMGIRIALGARSATVAQLVLSRGLVLALAGGVLGLVASVALTRGMSSLLYGVTPTDSITMLTTVALVGLVSLVATLVPALRAARVQPVEALRAD